MKRVDANQAEIVKALRMVGAQVQSLSQIGHGCPDLLVAFRGRWYVIEVKDGSKPPSKRALTRDEEEWQQRFDAPVHVCLSVEDALMVIGV